MSRAREWLFGNEPIQWLQHFIGLGHPFPFRVFSLLGDTWGITLVVGLAFWLFGRREAYAVAGIVAAGGATKLILTSIFSQTRPEGPGIVVYEHLNMSSFPSGHVYAAVGPWAMLYALGCVPLWVPALVVGLVSLGRLYLGTHYLGDVLGGILFGVLLVWLFARAWPAVRRWLGRRGWAFHATVAVVAIGATLAWMSTAGGHSRRFEVFGMILGAAVGLPLEYRLVGYHPRPGPRAVRIAQALLGTAGIVALMLWDRSRLDGALFVGTLTMGLAMLWAVLGMPALLQIGRRGRSATSRAHESSGQLAPGEET